jgi:hypothetical protein
MFHEFSSGKSDGGDATLVRPSNWNERHRVGDWLWPGITATPALDQADWNPTDGTRTWNAAGERDRAVLIRATPASVSFISGLVGGAAGRMAVIKNDTVDGLVCLLNEDTTSAAGARFSLRRESIWLLPEQMATLSYDPTESRWEIRSLSFDARAVDFNTALILPSTATGVVGSNVATATTATLSTTSSSATPTNDFLANPFTQITNSTANGSSDVRTSGAVPFMRGASAGRQGVFFNAALRIPAASATGGAAVGLFNSTAALTTLPDAVNNCIAAGVLSAGQTTMRVGARDASAMTQVDLGASFPVPNATAAYEVCLQAVAAQSRVIYAVRRLDSRAVAGGALTANLPGNTIALAPRANVMVGATAAATTLQFNRLLARALNY